jgi:poly-gamma-glutamate synthesis protein (capsule biosynthesis protein)
MTPWLLLLLGAAPVTVSAAGDLQLGPRTPEAQVAPLATLLEGDIRLVNLEGPLTASGREQGLAEDGRPVGPLRFNAPPHLARWMRGRVDAVSLANNHALDQGERGLEETVRHLREQGILAATASEDAELERRGRRVRLIARELSAPWPPEEEEALEAQVREARAAGPVLVSLHWGQAGSLLPTEDQRRLAARLVDAGATAVLGHGPHTPQGIERRGHGVIAYSLGNLAFSCRCTQERDAYVLRFGIDEAGAAVEVEARPLRAGLREPPRIAEDPGAAELLVSLSEDLGSRARIEGGVVRFSGAEEAGAASAGASPPEPPPAGLACLAKWYPVEPVKVGEVWMGRLPGGEQFPYDDGRSKSFEEKLESPDLKDMLSIPYRPGPLTPVVREDEDPGRIRHEPLFHAAYGATKEQVDVVPIDFLGQRLRVHRKVAPAFGRVARRLEAALAKEPALRPYLTNVGGTFHWRKIANTQRQSAHSYGVSLDLNPARAHYWEWAKPKHPVRWRNTVPQSIVDAFEAEGFIWGGRWYHYDTMHFEYRPELLDASCRPLTP